MSGIGNPRTLFLLPSVSHGNPVLITTQMSWSCVGEGLLPPRAAKLWAPELKQEAVHASPCPSLPRSEPLAAHGVVWGRP